MGTTVATKPRRDAARHGTRTMYQKGCHCTLCIEADRKYHRDRIMGRRVSKYVDAAPARERAQLLIDAGMTRRQLEMTAAVDYATLKRILDEDGARIQARTEERILAIDPETPLYELVDPWSYVPVGPYTEIVNRIWAQGYSLVWISKQVGMTEHAIRDISSGSGDSVRAFVAQRIAELDERIDGRQGCARDGRRLGKRGGVRFERERRAHERNTYELVSVDVDKLMRVLDESNMSVVQLSELSGVEPRTLNRVINEGKQVRLETLGKVATALYIRDTDLVLDEVAA